MDKIDNVTMLDMFLGDQYTEMINTNIIALDLSELFALVPSRFSFVPEYKLSKLLDLSESDMINLDVIFLNVFADIMTTSGGLSRSDETNKKIMKHTMYLDICDKLFIDNDNEKLKEVLPIIINLFMDEFIRIITEEKLDTHFRFGLTIKDSLDLLTKTHNAVALIKDIKIHSKDVNGSIVVRLKTFR